MCGRFFVALADPELRVILKEIEQENKRKGQKLPPVKTGMVFPTDYTAAKLLGKDKFPHFQQLRWGFSSYNGKGHLINARSETILDKAIFHEPVREARCLIPASYYYEWKKDPKTGKKLQHIMRDPKSTTLYMAAVYRLEGQETTPRYVILTRKAASRISGIHARMPVILDPPAQKEWLREDTDVQNVIRQAVERITALEDFPDE
jgi:putative SOS response-associated peptidase YedK